MKRRKKLLLCESVLGQMLHQSQRICFMFSVTCAYQMCLPGRCICSCLVETRIHKDVLGLISMKFHISSRHGVRSFHGIFQSFVRFLQIANRNGGNKRRRVLLVLRGGQGVEFPLLIITSLYKRLLCQNRMREV